MRSLWKYTQVVLAILLVGMLLGPAAPSANAEPLKAQPELVQIALQQPGQKVAVIVQKNGTGSAAEEIVARQGGTVTRDLHIINAFVAEMKADAAIDLARSEAVRWVSLDGAVEQAGKPLPVNDPPLANYYLDTLNVRPVWNMGLQGQDITIAVIDSGISFDPDFFGTTKRLLIQSSFSPSSTTVNDVFGHGTHVAGIIAGNGTDSNGFYSGIAPQANLISLKVSNETGLAYESDAVAALQWVLDNKSKYNIRVVNLSLNTTTEQSYNTSPMDAACEILWFNGIVVVASVGNNSVDAVYNPANAAPANDPFIITVGAADEKLTTNRSDDIFAPYSAKGTTSNGVVKPDILAPGTSIYSVLSKNSPWPALYPDRLAGSGEYFRLSGTSMAAPMVAGTVALLLQDEPNLTPDQVKYRLTHTGNTITSSRVAYPYLDVYAVVTGTTTQSANTGLTASSLLTTGTEPVNSSVSWNSVSWNSVSWNSVSWNSVSWNSVSWNSVSWNSTYWGK